MSTIPDAVDALVDVCRAALPGVRVDDGPVVQPYEEDADGVTTGVSVAWDADSPAIEAALDREQSDGMGADYETYSILSTLFKAYGNEDSKPLRDLAFADYEAIKAALRARHPLVPGVIRAHMTVVDYDVRPIEGGWDGRLRFAVEVTAFDRN